MRWVLAIGIASVTGCGGGTGIEPTVRFADLSDEEIGRAVAAGSGTDVVSAYSWVNTFGHMRWWTDACPSIAIEGLTATITGGCTAQAVTLYDKAWMSK